MADSVDLENEESENEEEEQRPIIFSTTVPDDIIEFKYSFGYDCKRLFNLCLIDEDTLVFASGNLLHYYTISKNEFCFRRTVFGGGVGFIIKNKTPEYNNLTIAENGKEPTVFIYKYPELEVVSQLKKGAVRGYTCGTYSNDDTLIATQAAYPDFMLTIWNWQDSTIILRSKAYQSMVLEVGFSYYNPILLASCGNSHVQFWKMARTFTGLKLKSYYGRFGKTDTCDVFTVHMLVDEKVISGCEWGNMLVWEGGLIKFEVTRKARRPCHEKPITGIFWMGNNELMTVGMDGYARIWFWETVELSDPPEEDRFVEIDPIYEFRIGDRNEYCEIRNFLKAKPNDESNSQYYTQDGNGGIWICDINKASKPAPSKKLFTCHGGRVVAGQASPFSCHIATLGEDGKLNIYNYETQKLVLREPFNSPGRDFIWTDTSIDPSGMIFFIAFADGVVREMVLEIINNKTKEEANLHFIKAIKPHAAPINFLKVSPSRDLLVSGAMDKTMFLCHIKQNDLEYVDIIPLGFILFGGSPNCLLWQKEQPRTALIGCFTGEVYECELPPPETIDLVKVRPTWRIYPLSTKKLKFKSVKSRIRRDMEIAAKLRRKAKKLARKKKEMLRLMEINPGLEFDENALVDSSEDEEEEQPLHIPNPPNPVLWLQYTNNGTIWLSMGGYDAGYVYEVKFGEEEPVSCTLIPEGDDIEINSYLYIEQYLVFGMQSGQIRINVVRPDFRDLSDFWCISMHDNLNGVITRIFTSWDGKWFFSVGQDGNIFYYQWNGPQVVKKCEPPTSFKLPSAIYKDIEDLNELSLEQVKIEENLVKLHAFEEAERRRLQPSFDVLQIQVNWLHVKYRDFFQEKLDAVLKRLQYDVTPACRDAQELYNLMFLPLEYIPFEVFGIREDVRAQAFRLQKLPSREKDAENLEGEGEEEEEQEEEHGEEEETLESSSTGLETGSGSKLSQSSTGSFIYDFPEKVLLKFYIRFLEFFFLLKQIKSEEIQKILELCDNEKEEEEPSVIGSEEIEYEDLEEEGAEEEEEESLIERALSFLKNSIPENVEVKELEIAIIYEILYSLKSEFNEKLIALKYRKGRIYNKLKKLEEEMNGEEEGSLTQYEVREIVLYNEYPEEVFKEPFIPLRSFESILWEKPMKKLITDEDEEELFNFDEMEQNPEEGEEEGNMALSELSKESSIEFDDIVMVNERIKFFDEELRNVLSDRLRFHIEIKYLEYIEEISIHELKVLQDSAATEKELMGRDEAAKAARNEIIMKIKKLKNHIEKKNTSFVHMREDIKQLYIEFYEIIKGNKFFKFLKRIFDKKFKPPKIVTSEDETESSSEESESDEDESEDDDIDNMTTIRLDETHCPAGCDRKLYDLSFEMRKDRYNLEQQIHDGQKSNEEKRKEIEALNQKMPFADEHCATERSILLAFRREKENKLRAIEDQVINSIEGFGLNIEELDEKSGKYHQQLEELLKTKKNQELLLKEELERPIEVYTEKLRLLLQLLIERDLLRRKKPSLAKVSVSESTISAVSVVKPPTPPPPFDFEAYAAEKILKLVQRFFFRHLAKYIPPAYMRKYIPKVARCLSNIGRNFTCELADNIIGVIIENLQRIVPKKYLIHAALDDIRSLFKDIVAVFELEPIEINPKTVITETIEKVLSLYGKVRCANKTQRIVYEMSTILIEELPMDDFRSSETTKFIAKLLARESVIIPKCLNVDLLIEQISNYTKKHMLSAFTLKIIKNYVEDLLKELVDRKFDEARLVKPKDKASREVRRKKKKI